MARFNSAMTQRGICLLRIEKNLDHLAIGVDDVDFQYKRLIEQSDCTEVEPPRTVDEAGNRVGYLQGIDGYIIELVEDI